MTRFLFAILIIGLAGLVFFEFTQPVLDGIGGLRAEKARLEAGLENAKKLREVQDQLLNVYNSFAPEDLVKLNKLLPDNIDTVRLVLDVNTIAERSGMKIKNIKIVQPEEKSQQALGGGENEAPPPAPQAVVLFGFSVTGPYTNFQSFLNDLATSLRLADVSSLTLQPQETGLYEYQIEVKTYWLK